MAKINATYNGVTAEDVTSLTIKNKNGSTIGTVQLSAVDEGTDAPSSEFNLYRKYEMYTYTPQENGTEPYVLSHALGEKPNYVIINTDWKNNRETTGFYGGYWFSNSVSSNNIAIYNMFNTQEPSTNTSGYITATDENVTIDPVKIYGSSTHWIGGRTYTILVAVN